MLRTALLALPVALFAATPSVASPLTFVEQANIFAESGGSAFTGLVGLDVFGSWTVSSNLGDGQDDNAGIPSPTYDVQVTFDNSALGLASSFGEVRLPGTTTAAGGSETFATTAVFYQDNVDLSADVAGTPYEPYIDTGVIYDLFELNASNAIGFQDPITGEFSPAAAPGTGEAGELSLFILADSSWFSGAPGSVLSLPTNYLSFIQYTSYDESAAELGFFAATNSPLLAPVPLPASLTLLLAGFGVLGAAFGRRKQA